MRGKYKKPASALLTSGSFSKHPDRLQARLAEPANENPLGDPPAHFLVKEGQEGYEMAAELASIWAEISRMAPWLTEADRFSVEDICELRYRSRHRTITPSERNTLRQLGSICGLDSAGRGRLGTAIAANKAVIDDPRDVFARRTEQLHSGRSND